MLPFSSVFHFELQSLDDEPPKNPWETTMRLQDGFISEYSAQYEHMARSSSVPPKPAIEAAYAAAIVADDPGLYDDDGSELAEEDIDYHHQLAEFDATNDMITTVTSINYQMPKSTRCRIPSGPYRVISTEERDFIAG